MSLPTEPGTVEHFYPVVAIVLTVFGTLVAVAGGLWIGFKWLRGQIRDEFHGLTGSEEFKKIVGNIITDATSGWNDLNNRQHEEHRRNFLDVKKRDEERADAIKRLHGRVDKVWEKLGGGA